MHLLKRTHYLRQGNYRKSRVFVRPGTPGPLLGYFNFRPGYFLRLRLQMFISLFPVVKPKPNNNVEHYSLYVLFCTMFCRSMAQNAPWGLKNSKIFQGVAPNPPQQSSDNPPPTPTPTWYCVPRWWLHRHISSLLLLHLSLRLQILTKTLVNLLFNPRGAYLFQTHLKEALD